MKGLKHPLLLKPKLRKDGNIERYWVNPIKGKHISKISKRMNAQDIQSAKMKEITKRKPVISEEELKNLIKDHVDPSHLNLNERNITKSITEMFKFPETKYDKLDSNILSGGSDVPEDKLRRILTKLDPDVRRTAIIKNGKLYIKPRNIDSGIEDKTRNKSQLPDRGFTRPEKKLPDGIPEGYIEIDPNDRHTMISGSGSVISLLSHTETAPRAPETSDFKKHLDKIAQNIPTEKLKKDLIKDTKDSITQIFYDAHRFRTDSPLNHLSKKEYDDLKHNINKKFDEYQKNNQKRSALGKSIADDLFSPDTYTSARSIIQSHFSNSDFADVMEHLSMLDQKYSMVNSTNKIRLKAIQTQLSDLKKKLGTQMSSVEQAALLAKVSDYLNKKFILSPSMRSKVHEAIQKSSKNSDLLLTAINIALQAKATQNNYIPPQNTPLNLNIPNPTVEKSNDEFVIKPHAEIRDGLLPKAPFNLEDITPDLLGSWKKLTGKDAKLSDFMLDGDKFIIIAPSQELSLFLIYRKWLNDSYFKLKTNSLSTFNKSIQKHVGNRKLIQINALTNKENPTVFAIGKILSDANYGILSHTLFDDGLNSTMTVTDDLKNQLGGKEAQKS